jgi:hypothetical protein
MKVKFLTNLVGANHSHNPGDIADVPDAEAARLIEAGHAVPVIEGDEQATDPAASAPVETTTTTTTTATAAKGKRGRRKAAPSK